MFVKNKFTSKLLPIFLSVSLLSSTVSLPIRSDSAVFAPNSYMRKSLRIVGGVGLLAIFAEKMIKHAKDEKKLDLLNALILFYICCYGFKLLSEEL